jgi:hypothetical protein
MKFVECGEILGDRRVDPAPPFSSAGNSCDHRTGTSYGDGHDRASAILGLRGRRVESLPML